MTLARSWQFVGSTGAAPYRLFDWLRRRLNRRLVSQLVASLDKSPSEPLRTLESGSGPGFATSLLARYSDVQCAICVDFDITALREGRRRDPALQCVVADIRRLPFPAHSFALVFNSSTVEHLDRPGEAVAEMARVCRSGGTTFVGVPYSLGPLGFEPLIRKTRIGRWVGPVFSRRSLEKLLEDAGIKPVRAFRYFWNFFIGMVGTR